MKLSVFLLSHNKNGFVQEAVRSVLDQDYADFELWIIENSTDGVTANDLWEYLYDLRNDTRIIFVEEQVPAEVRSEKYVPSWLLNKYYPCATGDVILYLSDDDLFMPGLFSAVDEAFTDNPDWSALYFHLARSNAAHPGQSMEWGNRFTGIPAEIPRGEGWVDCQIDGGQVAYYRRCLNEIGQPYFDEEMPDASHSDGTFLNKLASHYTFQPIDFCGVIHRHTPISTWTKS